MPLRQKNVLGIELAKYFGNTRSGKTYRKCIFVPTKEELHNYTVFVPSVSGFLGCDVCAVCQSGTATY